VVALITCLSALALMAVLTDCASERHDQSADQRIEDSRTAERVREALAGDADYKFDQVRVTASNGAIQLSGFVNTSAQRIGATQISGKVLGVKSIENLLITKN
jgi:hyperosmotically inducible protein